jgi:hypothetical protein
MSFEVNILADFNLLLMKKPGFMQVYLLGFCRAIVRISSCHSKIYQQIINVYSKVEIVDILKFLKA